MSDTGVGIAREYQQQIFERYKQADLHASAGKGMGIRPAIVQKILELHQSSIRVFSEKGTGATFEFELPTVLI